LANLLLAIPAAVMTILACWRSRCFSICRLRMLFVMRLRRYRAIPF
jgi:hypothetical protein